MRAIIAHGHTVSTQKRNMNRVKMHRSYTQGATLDGWAAESWSPGCGGLASSRNCRCGIVDEELHRIAADPAVAAQMTGQMDRDTARFAQELAERGPGGSEGDGPQLGRVKRIGQCAAQVPAPHHFSVRDPDPCKGEARFWIAGAERRQPLDMADQPGLS